MQSEASSSAFSNKYHQPYFTPSQIDFLSAKQRGKMSATQEEKYRLQACSFIEAIGSRIGFPRKTIATAQALYHRFHLFFPRKDFNSVDVTLASLYVSTKMHDTLKKPRELLAAAYAVRPDLAARARNHRGDINMNSQAAELDRQRLLAVERLILECICFNFTCRMPFPYVIKLGRALSAPKKTIKIAWRLAADSYWTFIPIKYPPHAIALGSLFTAALLSSFEKNDVDSIIDAQLSQTLGQNGTWEHRFQTHVEDLEDIAHTLLDLLMQGASTTSPSTPSSSSPSSNAPASAPSRYDADMLMRLKIAMRATEHPPRVRQEFSAADFNELCGTLLGRNEGTTRFQFAPPDVLGPSSTQHE